MVFEDVGREGSVFCRGGVFGGGGLVCALSVWLKKRVWSVPLLSNMLRRSYLSLGKVCVAVCLLCSVATAAKMNLRPIVGVVAQPLGKESLADDGKSYIAASYVKYLEMAGARVVPIQYNAPAEEIDTLLKGVNGLLFPGGGSCLQKECPFFQSAARMFQYAITANDQGDFFPIWGTCLGFQFLSVMGAGENQTILQSGFDSEDLPIPLNFTGDAKTSRLFAGAPAHIMDLLATQPITMNAHHSGVTPAAAAHNQAFSDFYSILSTNDDRAGRAFVSTIEGKKYPVYGTQFHPEKNPFEWVVEPTPIPHSNDAVLVAQYFANFFVAEARKSTHTFGAKENDYLIYNYPANFTGKAGGYFTQSYFFDA